MFSQQFVVEVKKRPQGRIDVAAALDGRFFDSLAHFERIAIVRR